jgi:hypothetical protein
MSALAYASGPVVFVAVTDVARTLAEVTRLGGRVLVPKLSLMNKGAFALIADPDGNVMGVTSAQGRSASQTPKGESRPEHVAATVAADPGTRSASSPRAARAQPPAKPAPTKVAPAPAAKSSAAAPPRASAKPAAKSRK